MTQWILSERQHLSFCIVSDEGTRARICRSKVLLSSISLSTFKSPAKTTPHLLRKNCLPKYLASFKWCYWPALLQEVLFLKLLEFQRPILSRPFKNQSGCMELAFLWLAITYNQLCFRQALSKSTWTTNSCTASCKLGKCQLCSSSRIH